MKEKEIYFVSSKQCFNFVVLVFIYYINTFISVQMQLHNQRFRTLDLPYQIRSVLS